MANDGTPDVIGSCWVIDDEQLFPVTFVSAFLYCAHLPSPMAFSAHALLFSSSVPCHPLNTLCYWWQYSRITDTLPHCTATEARPLAPPFSNRGAPSSSYRVVSSFISTPAPQAANADGDLSYQFSLPFQAPQSLFDVSLPATHSSNGQVTSRAPKWLGRGMEGGEGARGGRGGKYILFCCCHQTIPNCSLGHGG